MDTLWRDFQSHKKLENGAVVVVGHGLTNRLLCMRWFRWTPEIFNKSKNPENCDMLVLKKSDAPGSNYYELTDESLEILFDPELIRDIKKSRTKYQRGGSIAQSHNGTVVDADGVGDLTTKSNGSTLKNAPTYDGVHVLAQ